MGSAAINNQSQQNKNMSSFIEINNKSKSNTPQQIIQKPLFLNQNQQSSFNNVIQNIPPLNNQFIISSPSEFQPSKQNQYPKSNNPIANNHLYNHHLNQASSSISSPICNPSSGMNAISILTNQSSSQNFQINNNNNKINDSSASFLPKSNTDRKPEELDALANELLNEFSVKNTNPTSSNVPLSPLSSSSSSSSSTARSTSSSSSTSSTESVHNDQDQLIKDNSACTSVNPSNNNSNSITNKSGTLIIHRDANSSSNFSDKIKNLKIDNDLLQPLPSANNSNNNNNIQKMNQLDHLSSNMPQTFVSYNPNSKSFINQLGGPSCSFDNSVNQQILSAQLPSASSSHGLGVGSVIQPINESQLRKGNQVK